jgi:RimJ/RimL family protein N-acetyltransferase
MPEQPAAKPLRPEPMLRGELVFLGPVEPSDVIEDGRLISDPEIGHFLGVKFPISRDAAERFAKEMFEQVGKSLFPFNVCLLSDGRRIGSVALRDVDRENGSAEVAIFITERALLGRGFGTDALLCACDFGFGELRLERIELRVFDYNTRAMRSYEKAGFQTDVVKRHARFHRGQYHDVLVMSILRDEWLAQERRRAWEWV